MVMWQRGKNATRGRVALCVLSTALVLAACGAPSSDEQSAGVPDPDATLIVAWSLPVTGQLDPHNSVNYLFDFPFLSLVYDRLTQVVSGPDVAPMLAESWDFGNDGMAVDFRLRTDATFHGGGAVDATAVKRSLDRARDPQQSKTAGTLSMIDHIEAVDATTVRIVTNRPAWDLPQVLSTTEAAIIDPALLDSGESPAQKAAGSGPYVISDVRVGDRIVYQRAAEYWDPEAQKSATIELWGITDSNARLNAYRSGQVDMTYVPSSHYRDAESIVRQPGHEFHRFSAGSFYSLDLNVASAEFADPRVRRALNYAIDREGINESLLNGACAPTTQPLSPGFPGSSPEAEGRYAYDPERARQLLAEAGASELSFDIMHVAGLAPYPQLVTAVQSQLADIGVSSEILATDPSALIPGFSAGQAPAALIDRNVRATAPSSLLGLYVNTPRYPGGVPDDFRKKITDSLDPAISGDERLSLVQQASDQASAEAFEVPICSPATMVLFNSDVTGVEEMAQADFQGIYDPRYLGKTK
ncbi:ABC transporter substrate-binding protein [Rhodococcus artemisiae]|uniref:ABC transporter substrate-binding protein n=1 Tax=Rhodococcus artemisiae TaxID=714159 RepID=A0ABU7LCG8_9NOCA|nr:ABC transporter substrate-binding protein [Rhodococcus artemisiae]MEE2059241.1 ABC transporter substrate-binding protein [Rhodococcus artemisiae]